MSGSTSTTLVIGAGHAGAEAAVSLRQAGYDGRIVLIGDEPHLPYHRPPLSKAYLSGASAGDALVLKPAATYAKANVELRTDCRVESVNRAEHRIVLAGGETLAYDKLILATGSVARALRLPGIDEANPPRNVHTLRTRGDTDRIRERFLAGNRLVIIGGGYIGLEVAAVAIKAGLKVTVLEALPRVLARVTAPVVSTFYETVHREAGVDLRTGVSIQAVATDPDDGTVSAVVLQDGQQIDADLVVVGIGVTPNVALAEAAGLAIDNGIVVDEFSRTSDADIYAVGDCTSHPNPTYGRRVRVESVPNALEQARVAAAAIAGKPRAHDAVPWFWSDQYDLKLQMVGLSQGYDQVVVRGTPASRSFTVFYLKDGQVISADAVNRPKEFMVSKKLVGARERVDPLRLADESIPLDAMLASPAA